MTGMQKLYLLVPTTLFGAIVAGLFGKVVGRAGAIQSPFWSVAVSLLASLFVFQDVHAKTTSSMAPSIPGRPAAG